MTVELRPEREREADTERQREHEEHEDHHVEEHQQADIQHVASRVEKWLSFSSHSYERNPAKLASKPRNRDVVNPAATRIGHLEDGEDIGQRLRDLHEERDSRMEGNEDRRDRLDALRITQAVCNSLDLTVWERDRVLGVVRALEDTDFASEHAVETVAVVVARRVVDAERRAWLGLDDADDRPPERLDALADRLQSLTDSEQFQQLRAETDLSDDDIDRLEATVECELDDSDLQAAFGRSPYRDPTLPPFEQDG